jgi:glycosyltransferase involved in cell wall biosynthesis
VSLRSNSNLTDRVTIVVPAYNAASTIISTLNSIFELGFKHVVVVNDGSNDSTSEVVSKFPVLLINQENSGVHKARIRGLMSVQTDFVIFLDADDSLLVPIWKLVEFLSDNEGLVGAAGGYYAFGLRRRKIVYLDDKFITQKQLIDLESGLFPISASVWKAAEVISGQELHFPLLLEKNADDYELFIRTSNFGNIGVADLVVAQYSMVGGKSTKNITEAAICAVRIAHYYDLCFNSKSQSVIEFPKARVIKRRNLQLSYYNDSTYILTLNFLRYFDLIPQIIWQRLRRMWT